MSAKLDFETPQSVSGKDQISVPRPKRLLGNPKWVAGVSGNPSGHAAVLARKLAMLEHFSPTAIKRLGALVQSDNEQVALAAAREILDRTMGKPKQSAEVTVNTVDWTALHLEALRRMSEPQVLDVTPNEPNQA